MPKAFAPKTHTDAAPAERFRLSDHIGRTVAFDVHSVETIMTKYGEKDAVKADVTIIDGLVAGMTFGDVLLFQAAVVDSLRDCVDENEPIVALVTEATSKSGNAYLTLSAPTADQWSAAEKMFAAPAPAVHEAGF